MKAAEKLDDLGVGYAVLHGGLSGRERKAALATFRTQADCPVFLSTDAGGVGFGPMQAAKRGEVAHVLHRLALTESSWSAASTVPDPVLFDPTD